MMSGELFSQMLGYFKQPISSLSGNSEISNAYKEESASFFVERFRYGLIVGFIGYPMFGFLDYAVYPEYFRIFMFFRIAVIVAWAIVWAVTLTSFGKKHVLQLASMSYTFCSLSIVAMVAVAEGYSSGYFVGIFVVLIFLGWLIPLPFRESLITSVIPFVAYFVTILAKGGIDSPSVAIVNLFYFGWISILLSLGAVVTQRLRAMEFSSRYQVRQANGELEKLDLMKSRFFANVSHEVRTPLATLIGPLQMISEGDMGSVTEEQADLLKMSLRNAQRLLGQINQVLDFSALEAGTAPVVAAHFDIRQWSNDFIELFRSSAESKGLEVHFQCSDPHLPCWQDPGRIERIVGNLYRNAIKFTEKGRVAFILDATEDEIRIVISDTGVGINEAHFENIFARFHQVDDSTTRERGGSGLGLSIVSESVNILGGSIDVQSIVGTGTAFTFKIPRDVRTVRQGAPEIEYVASFSTTTRVMAAERSNGGI